MQLLCMRGGKPNEQERKKKKRKSTDSGKKEDCSMYLSVVVIKGVEVVDPKRSQGECGLAHLSKS